MNIREKEKSYSFSGAGLWSLSHIWLRGGGSACDADLHQVVRWRHLGEEVMSPTVSGSYDKSLEQARRSTVTKDHCGAL